MWLLFVLNYAFGFDSYWNGGVSSQKRHASMRRGTFNQQMCSKMKSILFSESVVCS
jgi:hypothetical protein